MLSFREMSPIPVVDSMRDGCVLDRPAVDKEILRTPARPCPNRIDCKTFQQKPRSLLPPRDDVFQKSRPIDLQDTISEGRDGRVFQAILPVVPEPKLRARPRQRGLLDDLAEMRKLGRARFEKLPPGRSVEEQIRDLDLGPWSRGSLFRFGDGAAGHQHPGSYGLMPACGDHPHLRHRSDARQRLATKAQGPDPQEVFLRPQLTRRM